MKRQTILNLQIPLLKINEWHFCAFKCKIVRYKKEGQSKIFKKGKKERTLYVTYLLFCF